MPLTFLGAEAYAQEIYNRARQAYRAVPRGIEFADEPPNDFGIAHFYSRTTGDLITFDTGRQPMLYVVWHELGHAVSDAVCDLRGGSGFTNGLYSEFFKARNFPDVDPWEYQLQALALNTPQNPNGGYTWYPEENFADAFGAVNSYGQGTLLTQQHGAYLDEEKLKGFYRALEGKNPVLTEEELEQIVQKLRPMFLDIYQKLDSGFNVTEVVHARRVAHGKDPGTGLAPIQEG